MKFTAFATAVLTHRLLQPGHTFSVSTTDSFHRADERYSFTNTLPASVGTDVFKLLSEEWVVDLNADDIRPLRQGWIETGCVGQYRSIPVNTRLFPGMLSPLDTGAGGWAKYRQVIATVYGTYVFESQRIELEGGMRLEGIRRGYDVNPDHNTYRSDGYRSLQAFPNVRARLQIRR